jgi:hypothetical protein
MTVWDKIRGVVEGVQNGVNPMARPPHLGPREVQDKRLDAMIRMRQSQLNEKLKERLAREIAQHQTKRDSESLVGVGRTSFDKGKVSRQPTFLSRGRL